MSQYAPSIKTVRLAGLIFLLSSMVVATASAQTFDKPATPPTPATLPASQGPVAPFDITGFIEFASVDSQCIANPFPTATNPPQPAGCKSAGGWIQVNNHLIRVPQNAVLQMPAFTLTWEEMFEFNSKGVAGETGLALSDSARLPGTFEAHVQGNIVNGTYIAGLIFTAQQSLNSSQGFIESLDYANGVMVVNGTRIQINDPLGKFSVGQSPDLRFQIDEFNPTIRAETGFPMCIPRQNPAAGDDPLCPQKNRPRDQSGKLNNIFTMDPRGAGPSPNSPNPTDPTVFAPFEVGDYVTYIGTLMINPATNTSYISANTIIGNVGIFTFPFDEPAYIGVDVVLQGVGGIPNPAFPQEAAIRTRVEGFTTDPSRTVDIYAIDVDCNGRATQREPAWAQSLAVDPGPPTGAVKGRWRFRPAGGAFLPPTAAVGARVTDGVQAVTNLALNIITDQYVAPNFEFIFPENLAVGTPPVPSNFQDLLFLRNGIGPWNGFSNQFIGQLNPFPAGSPPDLSCTPTAGGGPSNTANAVANFSASASPIVAGTTVTLSASGSTPTDGPFGWIQTAGPAVGISNAGSVNATFVAPTVAADTTLTFQVTVGGGNTTAPASATVSVLVSPPPAPSAPSVSATSSPANPVASGSNVTLAASGVDPANGTQTFTWTAPGGITLAPVAGTNGAQQTFTAPTVPASSGAQSFTFTVQDSSSASGLSSTANVTVTVNPQVDTVSITSVTYTDNKARLTVNATDNTPNVTLTVTLDIIDPSTGKPYTAVMGPGTAPGTFTVIFSNIPPPNLATVNSSAGGSASSAITRVK